jgi:radical SAM protein with 4Fe4S-binding SPASM domain
MNKEGEKTIRPELKYPRRIVLEVTTQCNLRCAMCAQSIYNFHPTSLSWEVFEKIIPLLPTAEEVTLFGWGEPLLHPRFLKMFEAISFCKHLKTYIVTNGTLLHQVAEELVKGHLTYLSISFDGATKNTYEGIRRGAIYEEVLDNIGLVQSYKELYKSKSPYIRFIFVASRRNIEELPSLVELAAQRRIPEIKVLYATIYHEDDIFDSLWFHRELAASIFSVSSRMAKALKVSLDLPPLIGADPAKDELHRKCWVPFEELYIGSNGKIRPCIISPIEMGDLSLDNVEILWNNEKFRELRAKVNSDAPPEGCRECNQNRHLNVNRYEAHIKVSARVPNAATVK